MNAFVQIQKALNMHHELLQVRCDLQSHIKDINKDFDLVFKALESADAIPKQGVFFK
tara:strand:- start:510 stop:680 length:171 start_codon:yes stop_codon:yes gene_type:complete